MSSSLGSGDVARSPPSSSRPVCLSACFHSCTELGPRLFVGAVSRTRLQQEARAGNSSRPTTPGRRHRGGRPTAHAAQGRAAGRNPNLAAMSSLRCGHMSIAGPADPSAPLRPARTRPAQHAEASPPLGVLSANTAWRMPSRLMSWCTPTHSNLLAHSTQQSRTTMCTTVDKSANPEPGAQRNTNKFDRELHACLVPVSAHLDRQ